MDPKFIDIGKQASFLKDQPLTCENRETLGRGESDFGSVPRLFFELPIRYM